VRARRHESRCGPDITSEAVCFVQIKNELLNGKCGERLLNLMAPCRGSHLTSCHHEEQALRASLRVCKNEQLCDPVTAILASGGAAGTSPRAGPPPIPLGGGGGATPRGTSAVVPAPKVWLPAVESRERAGAPGFSCRTRRRESHPPAVCATSTEAEARAGCIYPQSRLWPGRGGAAVRCRLSGPLHPRRHAVVGCLKDETPLST
jgi:hypothetical protein